jgi:hypothetical protein
MISLLVLNTILLPVPSRVLYHNEMTSLINRYGVIVPNQLPFTIQFNSMIFLLWYYFHLYINNMSPFGLINHSTNTQDRYPFAHSSTIMSVKPFQYNVNNSFISSHHHIISCINSPFIEQRWTTITLALIMTIISIYSYAFSSDQQHVSFGIACIPQRIYSLRLPIWCIKPLVYHMI